jgi:hypothetical protein
VTQPTGTGQAVAVVHVCGDGQLGGTEVTHLLSTQSVVGHIVLPSRQTVQGTLVSAQSAGVVHAPPPPQSSGAHMQLVGSTHVGTSVPVMPE